MSFLRTKQCVIAIAAAAAFLAFGTVNASTLTMEFDYSFGDPGDPGTAPPDGAGPWLTIVFDDNNLAGSVDMTMTVGAIGIADIDQVYLNLDTAMDANDLTFTRTGGTGPTDAQTSISTGTDIASGFKADADGWFDILLDFAMAPPSARFQAGETLEYEITGAATASALVASSFNFLSFPDPVDPNGPFLAAAKVLDTGSDTVFCQLPGGEPGEQGNGQCSDWIAPTPIPVPAAVWLFGSALGLLGWMRRRTN